MAELKVIAATLLAEHNTVQITDNSISNDSIFEVYVDNPDIVCNNIVVGGHTANITFDTKPNENVNIKVMVNNIDGEIDLSASGITYTTDKSVGDALDELYDDINNVVDLVDERVPDDTVLGGVLYHSTTGNNWKKLDATNLDYDDSSTIYSAMGDIDTLETTSKNLVGAINEVKESINPLPSLSYRSDTLNILSTGVSLESGGYAKYGNIVIVNLLFRLITTNTSISINGFPTTAQTVNISVGISSIFGGSTYPNIWGFINSSGQMQIRFNPATSALQENKYLQVMSVYLTNEV